MNKRDKKKRFRKHLLKRSKQTAKQAAGNQNNQEDTHRIYQKALDAKYDNQIKAKEKYLNHHAVLLHFCNGCGTEFYGRPANMLGKDHERHNCLMPYGDRRGNQFFSISTTNKVRKRKAKVTSERFYEMVINDYTPQEISKQLDIALPLVKDYFKTEGLL